MHYRSVFVTLCPSHAEACGESKGRESGEGIRVPRELPLCHGPAGGQLGTE